MEEVKSKAFTLDSGQKSEISKVLELNSLKSDPTALFQFIKSAIELREEAKFEFSRNLSDVLAIMENIALIWVCPMTMSVIVI